MPDDADPGLWEDLDAFMNRPAPLARELFDEGIGGLEASEASPAPTTDPTPGADS